MGCKTRDLFDQPTMSSSSSPSSSSSVRDALLFTTMCIIGLPVDVQVTDGSIYTGICHTACFDKEYGIILKKAKTTKNGKVDVVDMLVVSSCDIVQVVAKGVLLPSEGIVSDVPSENGGVMNGSFRSLESVESELQTSIQCKTVPQHFAKESKHKHIRQPRSSSQNENKLVIGLENNNLGDSRLANFGNGRLNGDFSAESLGSLVVNENRKVDSTPSAKIDETATIPFGLVAEGQVGKDQSQGKKYDHNRECGSHTDLDRHKVQLPNPSDNASLASVQYLSDVHVDVLKTSSNEPTCGNAVPSLVKSSAQDFERPASSSALLNIQSPSTRSVNMSSQLSTSQPVSQNPSIAPKDSVSNRSSKEFKLNPGAKTFMPMFSNAKPATPPASIVAASMDFNLNNPPVVPVAVAPPENAISPFASLPTKFVPYNNLVAFNGDSASQYSQPIVGHVGSRLQSVRYTSQYNPVQAGPTYVPPSSQAVMVGRLGQQLVYMHPVSHDLMQGSIAPIPVTVRPQLTPQAFLPKHQGITAAPALQVCATQPPFVVGGQQPYAISSNIPFSQPAFPTVRPIFVPNTSGHFSTKFL